MTDIVDLERLRELAEECAHALPSSNHIDVSVGSGWLRVISRAVKDAADEIARLRSEVVEHMQYAARYHADMMRVREERDGLQINPDDPDLMQRLAAEFRKHGQTYTVIGRESLVLRCVAAAVQSRRWR
jgi:hypothetical protein